MQLCNFHQFRDPYEMIVADFRLLAAIIDKKIQDIKTEIHDNYSMKI